VLRDGKPRPAGIDLRQPPRARDLANEALAYARDNQLEREEHLALQSLAVAELHLGTLEHARDCFEAVLRYRRGRTKEVVDTLMEAIPAYLGLGDIARAVAAADELLGGLEGDRMRAVFPAQGLWAAASAYAAAGKAERARDLRCEARTLLRDLAGRIDDEESRVGYLSLPFHRSILRRKRGRLEPGASHAIESAALVVRFYAPYGGAA
jgi:tetratricopeptide (TPR) repeat protein